MTTVNRDAFDDVADQLEDGGSLNLSMVGDCFGQEFWELLVSTLLDSNDAARAIAGAINRLREESIERIEAQDALSN